jgi:chemotaxis protein methyltransferase CheR
MNAYDTLRRYVYERSGISVSEAKGYLIKTRLEPVASDYGVSIDELATQVYLKPEVGRAVVDAMTTNETSFFRDAALWKLLQEELLREAHTTRQLSVWSAACSTGQEAYSLSILAREMGVPVQILGTDVSNTVVDKAREGVYSRLEVNRGLSAIRLLENFEQRSGDKWQLNEDIRKSCHFSVSNLLEAAGPGRYDLVFLRNVLIYFDDATRQRVFKNITPSIRPGGCLIIGASEGLLNAPEGFERASRKGVTVWVRKP